MKRTVRSLWVRVETLRLRAYGNETNTKGLSASRWEFIEGQLNDAQSALAAALEMLAKLEAKP